MNGRVQFKLALEVNAATFHRAQMQCTYRSDTKPLEVQVHVYTGPIHMKSKYTCAASGRLKRERGIFGREDHFFVSTTHHASENL